MSLGTMSAPWVNPEVYLTARLCNEILEHCREEVPNEACGIVPAAGTHWPKRVVRMQNVARNPQRSYAFDTDEQLRVWADMDQHGENPYLVYHSHPDHGAELSATDLVYAHTWIRYLVVSLADNSKPVFKAWFVAQDRKPRECPIRTLW